MQSPATVRAARRQHTLRARAGGPKQLGFASSAPHSPPSRTASLQATKKLGENGASSSEAMMEAVPVQLKLRLFVGGLGPTVGASDLQQRFAPLGIVHKIDLMEAKKGWDAEGALQRGFAYVDFEASTQASLNKLFSAYNGCKWKGGVLRVEKAKEHYTDRLRREWAEAEAKIAEKAPDKAIFSAVPSEPEGEAKIAEKASAKTIFSTVLSEQEEEEEESPEQSALGNKVQDSVVLKKRKMLTENPGPSSDDLPDQGEESSEFEDADEGLQVTESDASSDSEIYEDSDSDMEDFVDAHASAQKALSPTSLNEAAKASKWAKMFKSATSVAEPVEGFFSGSLDDADVPVKARPAVKKPRMFESAATAIQTVSVSEAPADSAKIVLSELEERVTRQSSGEEDASTSSEGITNLSNASKTVTNHITDDSAEQEDGADDQQEGGVVSGNLLARFNMEQDDTNPSSLEVISGAQSSGDGQGSSKDRDVLGLSNSTPYPEGQNVVDDNTKWMQRATWKSLMGANGRAGFSLKQLTGEPETSKAADDLKKTEKAADPERFGAFSFNFVRNPPSSTLEVNTTQRKSSKSEQAAKRIKLLSALEKSDKSEKVAEDEAGCSFMKSADAEKEWRASKSELRIDSKAKHKAAVRKMKKMKGSGGAR